MNKTMNTTITMIVAMISSLFFSVNAQEERPSGKCEKPTTVFYYLNGILTSYEDAEKARRWLRYAYNRKSGPEQKYEFKLSYNETHGLLRDILEVFRLKSEEENDDRTFWQLLSGEKPSGVNVDSLSKTMSSEIASRLPQVQPGGMSHEGVSVHANRFRRDLDERKRVLVIAHSQGSLLANAAISRLWREKWEYWQGIEKITVASPSSLYEKESPFSYYNPVWYVTAYDDRVINGLRLLMPNTLRGNTRNDPGIFNDPRDWLNHGFLSSYFRPRLRSRYEIDGYVHTTLSYLDFPRGNSDEHPIRISLYRDAPRAFYNSVIDIIVDSVINTSSTYQEYNTIYTTIWQYTNRPRKHETILENPEVVTVPCSLLTSPRTIYRVRIYFEYQKSTPSRTHPRKPLENARIEIVAGGAKRVFSLNQLQYQYSREVGDNVAEIIATKNAKGDILYTINDISEEEYITSRVVSTDSSSVVREIEAPDLAYRARVHAIPPPTARDRATIRVRCEDRKQDCKLWLDCTAPEEDREFSGWILRAIPPRGSIALEAQEIADAVGDWSGKGRLACDIASARKFSAQVWTRSGDGLLVNTGAFARSRRFAYAELDGYRRFEGVDIDSIPAPGSDEESNLRIRCADEQECTDTKLECAEDDGTLHEATLGTIPPDRVRHLQSEELAELIDHRWEGLGLSCEVQSDRSITVQALTRTAGILLNNGVSNDER